MLEREGVCYGLWILRKQEVMGLELVRMDWALPKGGKETAQMQIGRQCFWECRISI